MLKTAHRRRLGPTEVLLGSFALLILLGATGLYLPVMQAEQPVSFVDCLFTATSAVCVTGLITVDTAGAWSGWGQALIAFLIQVGGLGIMTFSMAMLILAGRRPSVRSHLAVKGSLGPVTAQEIGSLARDVLLYTLGIEAVGALALFARFSLDHPPLKALTLAVFHAISAFCNAGFSLFSDNLEKYPADLTINGVIMLLIVLGGIGFMVLRELRRWLFTPLKKRRPRLSLHTRLALATTLILIIAGALVLGALEQASTSGRPWLGSFWPILFTSVTARTAGFNTIPLTDLSNASLLVIMLLMFVGASPGSTGGGIKTTTLAALFALGRARLHGEPGAKIFKRALPNRQIGEAVTLVLCAALVLILAILVLLIFDAEVMTHQRGELLTLAFEAVSAFATVGLSLGETATLTVPGKLTIIALMYIGRLGPLTFIYSLAGREKTPLYHLAEEKIMLG